jgi:IS1 family transposase
MGLCKKKKSLSEEDFEREYGRQWIWASLDPESKLIINFFIGQRTLDDCRTFIHDLLPRIRTKPLFTSDELPHYETVLVENFSRLEKQSKTGKRGRPKKPKPVIDPEFKYATVHKVRQNGKVVKVERNIVFGNPDSIQEIIASSKVSKKINTSFIERANLTLRNYIPRKATNCAFSVAMNTNSCVAQACNSLIPHLRALLLMLIAHRKKRNLQPSEV